MSIDVSPVKYSDSDSDDVVCIGFIDRDGSGGYKQKDGMFWITLFWWFWWAPLLRGMHQRTHSGDWDHKD